MAELVVRYILAAIFVIAGIAHFVALRGYTRVMPAWVPFPRLIVQVTGILELLAALGLIVPSTGMHRITGIAVVLFLIAVFPANIEAARIGIPLSRPLWLRGVAQLILIAAVIWSTRLVG